MAEVQEIIRRVEKLASKLRVHHRLLVSTITWRFVSQTSDVGGAILNIESTETVQTPTSTSRLILTMQLFSMLGLSLTF